MTRSSIDIAHDKIVADLEDIKSGIKTTWRNKMSSEKRIISWTGYDALFLNVANRPNSKFVVQHHANGVNWEITEESFMETCRANQWKHGFFDKIIYSEHTNSFIYRG